MFLDPSISITLAKMDKMTKPVSTSPFLNLPPELRIQIYEHLLTATYRRGFSYRPKNDVSSKYPCSRLEVLLVSKTLHAELEPMLYKYGIFRFHINRARYLLRQDSFEEGKYALQIVIIDIDFKEDFVFWYDNDQAIERVTKLVGDCAARCDPNVRRPSCVVQLKLVQLKLFVHQMLNFSLARANTPRDSKMHWRV